MKIAIFGDSFADPNNQYNLPYINKAWYSLLRDKGWLVDNYAENASSLLWSVNNLSNCKTDYYDKIIFFATDIRRLTLREDVSYPDNRHFDPPIKTNQNRKLLQVARDWYRYFCVDDYFEYLNSLVFQDLRKTYGDKLLLLKCFECFNTPEVNNAADSKMCLWQITKREMKLVKKISDKVKLNHITTYSHAILAKSIIDWCEGREFKLSINDFNKMSKNYSDFEEFNFAKKA